MNVLVDTGNLKGDEQRIFFEDQSFIEVDIGTDMYDLLVMFGVYKSKNEARRNWIRTGRPIPDGFNSYVFSLREENFEVTILKPTNICNNDE